MSELPVMARRILNWRELRKQADDAEASESCLMAAGLWSYVLGDTVAFERRDPPLLRFTGRTRYFLSAFDRENKDSILSLSGDSPDTCRHS
jgi:hypothetical protein